MPYITPQHREALEPAIRELAGRIAEIARAMPEDTGFAGLLNFACTSLAIQVIEARFGASAASGLVGFTALGSARRLGPPACAYIGCARGAGRTSPLRATELAGRAIHLAAL
ncbi:MAG: hypothetical protein JOZ69_06040 [Myxococcales bacterium]|nr:hypothetical protein [Myxococcales bacterium]